MRTLREELAREIKYANDRFLEAKKEMLEGIELNPSETLKWHTEGVMELQEIARLLHWLTPPSDATDADIRESIYQGIETAMRRLLNPSLMNSTGMVHNVESLQVLLANRDFVKRVTPLLMDDTRYADKVDMIKKLIY